MRGLVERMLARWRGQRLPIWYDASYRLPLPSVAAQAGLEARRADLVLWHLLERRAIASGAVRTPEKISYQALARVHGADYLESLGHADTLARIFAVDPAEVIVDEVLETVRRACGGTLAAARLALETGAAALNLLGGFHHAAPDRGAGLCALNDVAVAVAALRADGFAGQIDVIDCDAHPPDGTAACLAGDARVFIGSLSGSDWGRLAGVDETRLPDGSGDAAYLDALDALVARLPPPALAFVIAGGDVLAGDRMGRLGLSLGGARARDRRLARALRGVPSVWLPGGGYHEDAWKVLAGTALVLAGMPRAPVDSSDPMRGRFAAISAGLSQELLRADLAISDDDVEASLTAHPPRNPKLLGYYTRDGIEHVLFRFGLLPFIERLGYHGFRVALSDADTGGDRVQLFARADGQEWLLVDLLVERRSIAERPILYVHWLGLRNPRAAFGPHRPRLPGQEVPGLGLAREVGQLLLRMCERLSLDGVAFRPAFYHTAFVSRHDFRFTDAARQGRFEALLRDLGPLPLVEASRALAGGRVRLDGEPYLWEADEMVFWLSPHPTDAAAVAETRERVHFTVENEHE